MSDFPPDLIFQPRVCLACNTTMLSGKWRDRCLHCGHPYGDQPEGSAPRPAAMARESTPYDCPLCNETPRACTCLRPSVRRRIAAVIGA